MQQPGPPRPDPVIQSLAIRAAEDPELKALMRIVASGKATQEQLKIFQGHIDALTPQPLVPARPMVPAQGLVKPQAQARPQQMHSHPQQLHLPQHLQHQQHMQHPHPSYMVQPHPQYQPHPAPRPQQAAPKPKPFPQPPKQEITAIVFEFTDPYSQGDRFLFPKYSILEYSKNGMQVIASFMVTRKPIDDLDEYYQPLTITLESASPRNLEILQRIVKDPDTTREHMKKLMATLKRADDTFLAFRLRRDPGDAVPDRLDAPLLLPPPPPPTRARESRVRRDASTPVGAAGGGANGGDATTVQSRPRVKNVKKALPKEPTTTTAHTSTLNTGTTTSATPTAPTHNTSTLPATPPPPKPPKPPRSRKGRIADPTKSCSICRTSKTSLWRKADIDGENVTVCNACGIKWKTNAQRAAQAATVDAVGDTIVVKGIEGGVEGIVREHVAAHGVHGLGGAYGAGAGMQGGFGPPGGFGATVTTAPAAPTLAPPAAVPTPMPPPATITAVPVADAPPQTQPQAQEAPAPAPAV